MNTGMDTNVRPMLVQASRLHTVGRALEAIDILRDVVRIDPRSFVGQYNLGILLAEQYRLDEAIPALRRALDIDPRSLQTLVSLAAALRSSGDLAGSIAAYRQAISIAPELAQSHVYLGVVLNETGDKTGAMEAVRRGLAVDPNMADGHTMLGQILQELGDLNGAEVSLRRALALAPGHVGALAYFAVVLQQLGKTDEAKKYLDYESLLRARRFEPIGGAPAIAAFKAEFTQLILGHQTLKADPPTSTTRGSQTQELLDTATPAVVELRRMIEASVADYMATVLAPRGTEFMCVPASWRVVSWGVVLRSSGYQEAHFHPSGIVSGVYYVRMPDVVRSGSAGDAGHIRFGMPIKYTGQQSLMTTTIKPEEGMVLLFPSYFWHNTMPFESTEDRISIAFDAIPNV